GAQFWRSRLPDVSQPVRRSTWYTGRSPQAGFAKDVTGPARRRRSKGASVQANLARGRNSVGHLLGIPYSTVTETASMNGLLRGRAVSVPVGMLTKHVVSQAWALPPPPESKTSPLPAPRPALRPRSRRGPPAACGSRQPRLHQARQEVLHDDVDGRRQGNQRAVGKRGQPNNERRAVGPHTAGESAGHLMLAPQSGEPTDGEPD